MTQLAREGTSAMIPDELYDHCPNCKAQIPVWWKSIIGGAFPICKGCDQVIDADWDDDPPSDEVTEEGGIHSQETG